GYASVDQVLAASNRALTVQQFKEQLQRGALVLDTRKADDFEKGFIKGAINIGLNGQYAIWVGTLIDIKQPLLLVTDEGTEHESVLRLARVGYENVVGYLKGGIGSWDEPLDAVHSITAEQMKNEIQKDTEILDVRKPGEWNTSHLKDAQFVPLADFPKNIKPLNKHKQYIVHCGGGYRSMTAISIMKREGFTNLTNVYGGFTAMVNAGLEIETEVSLV
ncbi:MAG: rhodanese-like domain-containing protein, partial [Bacteroidota bacterium]